MVEINPSWPLRIQSLLMSFDLSRAIKTNRGFVLPRDDEDRNPSVWLSVSAQGNIVLKDRTGRPTLDLLLRLGMDWPDLYPSDDSERLELQDFARQLAGGASDGTFPAFDDIDAEARHAAHSAILDALTLSDVHRQQLTERGFSPVDVERLGYKSIRQVDRGRLARHVLATVGLGCLNVPCVTPDGATIRLPEASGLLIPVRALDGRVWSLKVRSEGAVRYRWYGSGTSVALPHHPLGTPTTAVKVWVTEGELKADYASLRLPLPVLGVPGVDRGQTILPTLQVMKVRRVVIDFDTSDDPTRQETMTRAADAFAEALYSRGYEVEEVEWDRTAAPMTN